MYKCNICQICICKGGNQKTKKFWWTPPNTGCYWFILKEQCFRTSQRPAQWKVVLSLCGDTSERHCEKASSYCWERVFGSMRVLISYVFFVHRKWNCFVSQLVNFAQQDRRFVFECRSFNKRFKSTHLWEPQRVWYVLLLLRAILDPTLRLSVAVAEFFW